MKFRLCAIMRPTLFGLDAARPNGENDATEEQHTTRITSVVFDNQGRCWVVDIMKKYRSLAIRSRAIRENAVFASLCFQKLRSVS